MQPEMMRGWRRRCQRSAAYPHPGVDQPESDGQGVDHHLPPRSLLMLLLQSLQSAVQLHDLNRQNTQKSNVTHGVTGDTAL